MVRSMVLNWIRLRKCSRGHHGLFTYIHEITMWDSHSITAIHLSVYHVL